MTSNPADLEFERRIEGIVVPLTTAERHRLEAWAQEQEREASQAIRFLLRDVIAGTASRENQDSR